MAYAIETQIVPFLKERLETITEANGYSFTTRAVYPTMPNEATLDDQGIQPCIFIWRGVCGKSLNATVGEVQNELDIHLVISGKTCYYAGDVGAEMVADVEQLLLTETPFNIGGALVNIEPVSITIAVSDLDQFQPGGYAQYLAKFSTVIGDPRTPGNTY